MIPDARGFSTDPIESFEVKKRRRYKPAKVEYADKRVIIVSNKKDTQKVVKISNEST